MQGLPYHFKIHPDGDFYGNLEITPAQIEIEPVHFSESEEESILAIREVTGGITAHRLNGIAAGIITESVQVGKQRYIRHRQPYPVHSDHRSGERHAESDMMIIRQIRTQPAVEGGEHTGELDLIIPRISRGIPVESGAVIGEGAECAAHTAGAAA